MNIETKFAYLAAAVLTLDGAALVLIYDHSFGLIPFSLGILTALYNIAKSN